MFHVLALDDIARAGLARIPTDRCRVGYDPQLTRSRAWELSSEVRPATPGILSFPVIEAEPDPGSAA